MGGMGQTFSLAEVFRVAEQIEANGCDFYARAAVAAADPAVRRMFRTLAEQEREHREVFVQMRAAACGRQDVHWVDPDGEAQGYLRAVAENHVFTRNGDVSALLGSVQSPASVLRLAIGFERDTIAYFAALKESVSPEQREKVDLLIGEELKHLSQLQGALEAV